MASKNVRKLGTKPGSRPFIIRTAVEAGQSYAQILGNEEVVKAYTVKDGKGNDKFMVGWVKIDHGLITGSAVPTVTSVGFFEAWNIAAVGAIPSEEEVELASFCKEWKLG